MAGSRPGGLVGTTARGQRAPFNLPLIQKQNIALIVSPRYRSLLLYMVELY